MKNRKKIWIGVGIITIIAFTLFFYTAGKDWYDVAGF
jgi:hypothetical protein